MKRLHVSPLPLTDAAVQRGRIRALTINLAAAVAAVLLGCSVVDRVRGDGVTAVEAPAGPLADMVARSLSSGDVVWRAHPLVPMVGQVVHDAFRADLTATFTAINVASLGLLAFALCVLLDRLNAPGWLKLLIAAHVPLLIATSRLPAFSPVGAEVPAYALCTFAVAAIVSGRRAAVVVATTVAVLAHWAALLPVVFGWVRDRRTGVAWPVSAATYAPAVAVCAASYWSSVATAGAGAVPALAQDLLGMLADVPTHPGRILASAVALACVFGGVSLALVSRGVHSRFALEREWLAYGAAVAGLAVLAPAKAYAIAGFAAPVIAAAAAAAFSSSAAWPALAAWTALGTLWTQQPWHPYASGSLLWPGVERDVQYWLAWVLMAAFIVWFAAASRGGDRRDAPLAAFGCTAAVLLATVGDFSGLIQDNGGLGYDGEFYVAMMQEGYAAGTWDTRLRPLVVFLNRLPDRFVFSDPIATFRAMNLVYAFGLGVVLAALSRRYGASTRATVVLIANLSLCIATTTMFAYYPTLIDLGAYFVLSAAVLAIVVERRVAAAVLSVLAVASREFGAVAVLFGVARDLRLRRGLPRVCATYLPAVAAFAVIRMAAAAGPVREGAASLTLRDTFLALLGNVSFWLDPRYAIFWVYFALTLFGGVSLMIAVFAPKAWKWLRSEPEWLAIIVPVVLVTALGRTDMWRYAAFLLPAVPALWAWTVAAAPRGRLATLFVGATLVTLITQRPWQRLNEDLYFRDWYPYFTLTELNPADALPVWPVWSWRLAIALAALAALSLMARPATVDPLQGIAGKRR